MVLQTLTMNRLHRLSTYQRPPSITLHDPIPELKERIDDDGADVGFSEADLKEDSGPDSRCSSGYSSRKTSTSSLHSSRKFSSSSSCSSRRSSFGVAAMGSSELELTHTVNNNVINHIDDVTTKANFETSRDPEKSDPSVEDLRLLRAMEEANRLIETDAKSLNAIGTAPFSSGSTAPSSGHSRRSSDTSQISVASETSGGSGGSSGGSTGPLQDPEEDLWGLWGKLIADWENWLKKRNFQLKDMVRRGIPHHFRGITWQLLCSAHNSPEKAKYAEYMKTTSACEKVIRRDIARTYPEHDFFKEKDGLGQESLFNVMKAYSLHDREVGYCQGSAFIVGLLLMQMPEEEAFAVLVKLMQDYRLREMFKPSMAELGLCMYQLECLIQEHLPDLHAHFTSQSFHTSMYASSWFLTLLSTTLPLALACRVMDCFLVDGIEVIFRIAIAILSIGKEEIFCMDMEGMLKYFQRDMPLKFADDSENYFQLAYSIKYYSKKMKKMEKDYTAMKTKEQEELVELRRLRTENRLLRQRIDCLEAESSALADRLIQGQVSRAEEAEHNFAIKRELAALRQHDGETNEHLAEARDKIRKLTGLIEENCNLKESSLAELMIKEEYLTQKEELVKCLQEELVQVRLKTAEAEATIRDLRARVQEVEQDQKKLRESTPDHSVAHLQEELIAVRLREAEANLALKDLRHRVQDLTQIWTKHCSGQHGDRNESGRTDPTSTPSKKLTGLFRDRSSDASKLEEELMTTKLHETSAVAELKESRLKVMELETAVQVSTNQMKRQDEENKRLQEALENAQTEVKRVYTLLGDHKRKYVDLEGQMKEEKMMARIREAEKSQSLAELTQKISSLEFKNQELVTEGEVSRVGSDGDQVPNLQEKIADLKAEMARLTAINHRLLSRTVQRVDFTSGPESDPEDTEDLHLKLDQLESKLRRDSSCGIGRRSRTSSTGSVHRQMSIDEDAALFQECERKCSVNSPGSDISALSPEEQISPNVRRSFIGRRTSQTIEDAFLEQLPEIKDKNILCNGSTTSHNGRM